MNPSAPKNKKQPEDVVGAVVPEGMLRRLKVSEIKPSTNNPRYLFDPAPLLELKENIRIHGVLVPITVYAIKGQHKFGILDGERRYRCCVELAKEGFELTIPANIVTPPNKIAGILYMFSIHNFREGWELMPTALKHKISNGSFRRNRQQTTFEIKLVSAIPKLNAARYFWPFRKNIGSSPLDPNRQQEYPPISG